MRTCTSLTSSTNQPAPWSSSTLYHSPRRRPRSSANSPLPRAHPIAPFTLLLVLRRSVPDEHEDRRLGDHEVLAPFECDLHRRLAEEQRIVAHARLHRQVLYLGPANLPWLVVHARGLGHRRARAGCHHAATLHLARFDRRRRQVEADVGALFPLFGRDEHPVAYDDEPLGRGRLVRHGHQYRDRKSTRLNSSHPSISYAVFCLKKKKTSQCHTSRQLNASATYTLV